jgi:Zn-dependent protease
MYGWAKPVPVNIFNLKNPRWGSALVSFAGPGSNFVMAFAAAGVANLLPLAQSKKIDILDNMSLRNWEALSVSISGNSLSILFVLLCMIMFWNIFLGIFNMLPFPPLDGSKIMYAVFNFKQETIAFLEQYGFVFLLLFILLSVSAAFPVLSYLISGGWEIMLYIVLM